MHYHLSSAQKTWKNLQGISKRLFPGFENMWWKNCVFLPAEGKQNATFSPDFSQPGKSLIEIPCICGGENAFERRPFRNVLRSRKEGRKSASLCSVVRLNAIISREERENRIDDCKSCKTAVPFLDKGERQIGQTQDSHHAWFVFLKELLSIPRWF